MLLILHIQPHNAPIRILARHHPAFNPDKDPTMLDLMPIEPLRPLLEILPGSYAVGDRISALLRCGLVWYVTELEDQLRGVVLAHLGEEFVVGGEVVVLGQGREGEDGGVEVVGLFDGGAGELEVVDAVE